MGPVCQVKLNLSIPISRLNKFNSDYCGTYNLRLFYAIAQRVALCRPIDLPVKWSRVTLVLVDVVDLHLNRLRFPIRPFGVFKGR